MSGAQPPHVEDGTGGIVRPRVRCGLRAGAGRGGADADDAVGDVVDERRVVRDHERDRASVAAAPFDRGGDEGERVRVEPAGRFVEDEQFGVAEQGAGDRDPLRLAAGQFAGAPVPQRVRVEAEAGEARAGGRGGAAGPFEDERRHGHQRVQGCGGVLVEEPGGGAAQPPGGAAGTDGAAVPGHGSGGAVQAGGEDVEGGADGRGLAPAGRPDDRDDLAGRGVQADAVDDRDRPRPRPRARPRRARPAGPLPLTCGVLPLFGRG
ncbi:hypothetical protein BJF79_43320 [Actinomadura sp. CNU-125]|nr:hypothetical protein [Actinomadura sp. CNU-125]OLT26602.1 hypothetical protein BJF79_43320 [Actinomadura sp. CNU-125]